MDKTIYSDIKEYRYHFNAICLCKTDAQLTAVGESIGRVVPAGHKELPILVAAGAERRKELKPKRILICGSRYWTDVEKVVEQLKRFEPSKTTIVHGAASGADIIAAEKGKELGFTIEVHPAEWDKHPGNSAGFIRNKEMIESGVDEVIAFWRRKSKGTKLTIDLATLTGIELTVVEEN